MAIQAQIYPDFSGFSSFIAPEFAVGGGGAVCMDVNTQRQQFVLNKVRDDMETTSFVSLNSQLAKQNFEIDHLIFTQNERLKQVLREQRKRDATELIKEIETRTSFLLNQKEDQITKAKTRSSQLESLLIKLQSDALTWQQVAKQNELHVINLNNTIQLLQQQQQQQQQQLHQSNEQLVEDTESCCDVDNDKMVCRVCERRVVGVVMLPCRHMCVCSVCDPMIDLCPVCRMVKKGSVEPLFC